MPRQTSAHRTRLLHPHTHRHRLSKAESACDAIAAWLAAAPCRCCGTRPSKAASSPYQRGQFRLRRFRSQAEALCVALAGLNKPAPAPDFVHRAPTMLQSEPASPRPARVFTAALHSLCSLRYRLGARLAAPDCLGLGSGSGALLRRSGAADLRRHRALEPEQEAASDSHLR